MSRHIQRILELRDADALSNAQLRNLLMDGLSRDPDSVGFADMILAGFQPAKEPYLRYKLARMLNAQIARLGAGRIALPGSLYFTGIPDFTGSLAEGTVAAVAGGDWVGEGKTLIYRAPGTHVGDVRKVDCVVPPLELRELLAGVGKTYQNALFFSTRGARALADMLSGGDYDGDEFLLICDREKFSIGAGIERISIVEAFDRISEPWDGRMPPTAPGAKAPTVLPDEDVFPGGKAAADEETSRVLVEHYLDCNRACGNIGRIAVTLQMATEAWTAGDPRVKDLLVACYNGALDASKNGSRIDDSKWSSLRYELDRRGLPEFFTPTRHQLHSYGQQRPGTSWSALAQLYRNATEGGRGNLPPGDQSSMDQDMKFIQLFECCACDKAFSRAEHAVHEPLCVEISEMRGKPLQRRVGPQPSWTKFHTEKHDKWTVIYREYNARVRQLSERSRGGAVAAAGAVGKPDEWQAGYNAILADCRAQLVGMGDYSEDELENPSDKLLVEASLVYLVCYQEATAKNLDNGREAHTGLAFAWNVAGPYLLHLKVRAQQHRDHPGKASRPIKGEMLHRVVGAGRTRRLQQGLHDAVDPIDTDDLADDITDDGSAGGGGDDDFISTPWSRCE